MGKPFGWENRQQRRKRRRRLYRIRQRVIELGILLLLAAVIVVPIWLLCQPNGKPNTAPPQPQNNTGSTAASEGVLYPQRTENTADFPAMTDAYSAVLLDVTTNTVVAARNADEPLEPASIAKVMTLLVAVEHITDYTETFEMPYQMINELVAKEATRAGFCAGEKVCMTDLLYGTILPSGADATGALARHIAGSEEAFAQLMNDKAKELGLKNTKFTNSSGLHEEGNHTYTTATDMAVIMKAAMENPLCRQVLSTVEYTTTPTEQNPEGLPLVNTMFKRMVGNEPGHTTIIAGKTGYTYEAKHTMVSYATGGDGHDYIFVSMRGTDKYEATYDAIEVYSYYCAPENTQTQPTNYPGDED